MNNSFKVKFRGTRGSYPTPCADYLKFGGNTSCVEVNVGGNLIILDAGGGIITLGDELLREHILSGNTPQDRKPIKASVILSHIHQDHIQGLPFFKPLYNNSTTLEIFGLSPNNEDLKSILSQVLFEKVFPLGLEDISCNFKINNLNERQALILNKDKETRIENIENIQNIEFDENDVLITAHKTFAHPKNGCLCVKIQYQGKTLVYATDKESYKDGDRKFVKFAHDADVLIHDAQYTTEEYSSPISPKQGFGHSTFEMAIENAKLAHVKKLYFFHYDPNYNDNILENLEKTYQKLSPNYIFAKENMEIVL
ncbi:MAG: MBL fold metallo-hydrolase [Cyanobacteria bacterium SIG30]|nr:MBL fold metallo-hydrolase [Cyanobacteria bacterium SIG30]